MLGFPFSLMGQKRTGGLRGKLQVSVHDGRSLQMKKAKGFADPEQEEPPWARF